MTAGDNQVGGGGVLRPRAGNGLGQGIVVERTQHQRPSALVQPKLGTQGRRRGGDGLRPGGGRFSRRDRVPPFPGAGEAKPVLIGSDAFLGGPRKMAADGAPQDQLAAFQ
jgi:hypothetical protein